MLRVIVNVRQAHQSGDMDLEVPAEIPASELVDLIAKAMGWTQVAYDVIIEPPGRSLKPSESLADAGAWDGVSLVLIPQGGASQFEGEPITHTARLNSPEGGIYLMDKMPVMIGRKSIASNASMHLIDLSNEPEGRSVSRNHAQINRIRDEWTLTPLHGRQNRTIVDGIQLEPAQPHILRDGMQVQFGRVLLTFVDSVE